MSDHASAVLNIVRTARLDCHDLVPLRSTNNTVFLLDQCDIVAKVHDSEARATRELDAGHALATIGAPIVAPAAGIGDRVHSADGVHVTFWDYIAAAGDPPSTAVAIALLDLHRALASLTGWVGSRTFEEQLTDAIDALRELHVCPDA